MSSQRRIDASRANGAKSQGPVTSEGRQRSALNALTHGLTSGALVLQNESGDAFEALKHSYIETFQPANGVEFDLVAEMVAARWRQRRAWCMETRSIDLEIYGSAKRIKELYTHIDEDSRASLGYRDLCTDSRVLDQCTRTESIMSRMHQRALQQLLLLQDRRRKLPPAGQNPKNEPSPINEHPAFAAEPPADTPIAPAAA